MLQDVCHPTQSRTGCWTSEQGTGRWTLEMGHDTPDTRDRTRDTSHTGYQTQDTGHWTVDVRGKGRHQTQDTGHQIWGRERRTQNTVNGMQNRGHQRMTQDIGRLTLDGITSVSCYFVFAGRLLAAPGITVQTKDATRSASNVKLAF